MTQETQSSAPLEQEQLQRAAESAWKLVLATAREPMQKIAKGAANAIAKAWLAAKEQGKLPSTPKKHFKEIVVDLESRLTDGYAEDIASAAGAAIDMCPPMKLARLPVHDHLGYAMGEQKSDCETAWVRWRIYYDGHRQKFAATIDWAGDID